MVPLSALLKIFIRWTKKKKVFDNYTGSSLNKILMVEYIKF